MCHWCFDENIQENGESEKKRRIRVIVVSVARYNRKRLIDVRGRRKENSSSDYIKFMLRMILRLWSEIDAKLYIYIYFFCFLDSLENYLQIRKINLSECRSRSIYAIRFESSLLSNIAVLLNMSFRI